MQIIERKIAKSLGLKFYFSGKPCVNGQIAERYVVNKQCRCSLCKLEYSNRLRKWQENNNDKIMNQRQRYYEENRESILARNRIYNKKNKEKLSEYRRIWLGKNLHVVRIYSSKRRAANQERIPVWFGELDQLLMEEAAALAAERTEQTGFEWHVDHKIPLRARKASGLHCADNIQVIPARLNLSKNNRLLLTKDLEWLSAL
jgi:hypothetical protein